MKILISLFLFALVVNGAMLLKNYDGRELAGWVMSEKFDGLRAIWDGKKLKSRQGKEICAPKDFINAMPPFSIDGELWIERGAFEQTFSIISRCDGQWSKIKYLIFDAPDFNGDLFARLAPVKEFLKNHPNTQIQIIEQIPIKSKKDAFDFLDKIVAKGGEGVVVRDPNAPYKNGRQSSIMKLKKMNDAECKVLKITARSDDKSAIGSVLCQDEKSKITFKIGSGFSGIKSCEISNEPCLAPNDIITYKYQNLTKNAKPRFAVFVRKKMEF